MDIKSLKTHVTAFREAYKQGILSVSMLDGSVQVTDEVLQDLLKEIPGGYDFKFRGEGCDEYPYRVSLKVEGTEYYTVCDEDELKNRYGGDLNELITTN